MKKIKPTVFQRICDGVSSLVPFHCTGSYWEVNNSDEGAQVVFVGSTSNTEDLTKLANVLRTRIVHKDSLVVGEPVKVEYSKYTILITKV